MQLENTRVGALVSETSWSESFVVPGLLLGLSLPLFSVWLSISLTNSSASPSQLSSAVPGREEEKDTHMAKVGRTEVQPSICA